MIYRSGDEHIYSAPGKRGRIAFYLNGMKIDENVALELNLTKFESIEILTSNIPAKYNDFSDGVILLETRKPDKPINAEVTAMNHSDYLQNYDFTLSGVTNKDDFQFTYMFDTEFSANDTRFKDEFGANPNEELPNLMNTYETYDFFKNENPVERDFLMGNFAIDFRKNLTIKAAFLNENLNTHPYEHQNRYAMLFSKVTEEENSYRNIELDFNPIHKTNLAVRYNIEENIYSEHPDIIELDDYFTPIYGNAWEVENGFDLYSLDDNNRNYTGMIIFTTSGDVTAPNWSYLSDGSEKYVPGFNQPGLIYDTYFDKKIARNILSLDLSYEINESSKLSAGYSYTQQDNNYSITLNPWIVDESRYDGYLAGCTPVEFVAEGDPLVDNRPYSPTYGDTLISAVSDDLSFYSQEDLFAATEYASGDHGKLDFDQDYSSGYLSYEFSHSLFKLSSALKLLNYDKVAYKFVEGESGNGGISLKRIEKNKTKFYPSIYLSLDPCKMINLKLGIDARNIIESKEGIRKYPSDDYGYIEVHNILDPTLTTSEKFYTQLSLSYKFISNFTIGYQVVDVDNAYYTGEFDAYNNNDYIGDYRKIKDKIFYAGLQLGSEWIMSPGMNYSHVDEEIKYSSRQDMTSSKYLSNLKVNFGKIISNPVVKNLTMDIEYLVQDGMPYVEWNEAGYPVSNSKYEYMKPTKSLDLKLNYFTETNFGEISAYISVKNLLDRKNELYVYPMTGSPTDDGADLSGWNSDYVASDTEAIYNLYTANPANVSEGMTLQFGLGFRW